jgi:hypothetical protein
MSQPENQHPQEFDLEDSSSRSIFLSQVERLHRFTVLARWAVVCLLWIGLGSLSIWGLRSEIELWLAHFTWVAVRYAFAYNPVPAFGLFLCIAMTLSVLVWQSRNILFGMPHSERQRLELMVLRIRRQGSSHPLWRWVCRD